MYSYLPPGYSGIDRPSERVHMGCKRGHVWATTVHYEYGTSVCDGECPYCGMDGERTDDPLCSVVTSAQCDECLEWDAVEDVWDGLCWRCQQKYKMPDFTSMETISRLLGVTK